MRVRVESASPTLQAAALAVAVSLAKLPLVFQGLGEQDQARLLLDAIVYAHEGPATLRTYGILTSPLWALPLAGIAGAFGPEGLVPIANLGGWLCGGLTTAMCFLLLESFGASRAWAAAGAVATALVPGVFYLSLYGYPTQYALSLLLLSALLLRRAQDRETEPARTLGLASAGLAYCAFVLMKIDFAIAGTFLLSIVWLARGRKRPAIYWLPGFALVAVAAVLLTANATVETEGLRGFLDRNRSDFPWEARNLVDASGVNVLYACGFGTLLLFAIASVVGLARRDRRAEVARLAGAWALAVAPVWLFWLARPPMTGRHAAAGVLLTALYASATAARVWPRAGAWAWLWPLLLVTTNWPFGEPNFDFNYRTSGDLAHTLQRDRRAFAVADEIARSVVARRESMKIVVGGPRPDVFGNIDFYPVIALALAERSHTASGIGDFGWALRVGADDGFETKLFHVSFGALRRELPEAGLYAPWGANLATLARHGIEVQAWSPVEMYEALGRRSPPGRFSPTSPAVRPTSPSR
jgi:hypothetical protein